MSPLPSPDRWRRLAPLLEEAIDLGAGDRARFLDRACGDDDALRRDLEALLGADAEAGAFLRAPVDLSFVAPGPDEAAGIAGDEPGAAGTTIGPYRVVREIGRGGMGVVYEAEQRRPQRPVALKVILGGRHADEESIRMFRRETESLARLKHPGIATIYESGSTEEGQHYFAMELVRGRTLSGYLETAGPAGSRHELRRRLGLFRKIAAAVAYAHQRGVIHRDLKPSNILVLPAPGADGEGQPGDTPDVKVLDFGLARISDPDGDAPTAVTEIGRIRGTLPYMSPEQVRGRRDDVDVRTDVYSLGVILHRMLAGRLPFDLAGVDLPEAARRICEQPPPPLRAAAGAGVKFDRDLVILAGKALEKEPARRYPTVAALDEDVARYLAGQPIAARPPSALYQIGKLVGRHKAPFAAAIAGVAALLAFAVVTAVQSRRIAAERDRADLEAKTATRVSAFMIDLFKVSDPDEARGNEVRAREILDAGVRRIGKELADEPEVQSRLMLTMGEVYSHLGLYADAVPILEQSVATRRRLLGEEHADTLAAMATLAFQYSEVGRLSEAETMYLQVLDARRRLRGDDDVATAHARTGLARVHRNQGRFVDAEALDRQALATRRRALGDDHKETFSSMVGLASDLYAQNRVDEALAIEEPAVEGMRRVLGEDHPMTLGNVGFLAKMYGARQRYAEAERLLADNIARLRAVVGETHPHTLEAKNVLAIHYFEQGRTNEAEPIYREVLEARRRALGDDHQDTLGMELNLAGALAAGGRQAEAATLLRSVYHKARRALGEEHPLTQFVRYNFALLAADRGNRAGALGWLAQLVDHGWSDAGRLEQDAGLKPLQGDPAFEALLARSRKNPAR